MGRFKSIKITINKGVNEFMKRKFLIGLLCFVCLISLSGCGNKSTTNSNDEKNHSSSNNNQEVKNDKYTSTRKVYQCKDITDTDEDMEYKLYYDNSKLTKVLFILNYGDDDNYQEAKDDLKGYSGVSVKKVGSKITMEFDINKGGLKALEEEDKRFQETKGDTSFENLNKYMKQTGFVCNLEN